MHLLLGTPPQVVPPWLMVMALQTVTHDDWAWQGMRGSGAGGTAWAEKRRDRSVAMVRVVTCMLLADDEKELYDS